MGKGGGGGAAPYGQGSPYGGYQPQQYGGFGGYGGGYTNPYTPSYGAFSQPQSYNYGAAMNPYASPAYRPAYTPYGGMASSSRSNIGAFPSYGYSPQQLGMYSQQPMQSLYQQQPSFYQQQLQNLYARQASPQAAAAYTPAYQQILNRNIQSQAAPAARTAPGIWRGGPDRREALRAGYQDYLSANQAARDAWTTAQNNPNAGWWRPGQRERQLNVAQNRYLNALKGSRENWTKLLEQRPKWDRPVNEQALGDMAPIIGKRRERTADRIARREERIAEGLPGRPGRAGGGRRGGGRRQSETNKAARAASSIAPEQTPEERRSAKGRKARRAAASRAARNA